jgi:hypothetical protein
LVNNLRLKLFQFHPFNPNMIWLNIS